MPGFNQRGPQGLGPMTGRGQGNCGNRNMPGTGAGFGGRGCGRGFRGNGRGMGRGFVPTDVPVAGTANETTLQDRARVLEQELNAVKAQLKTLSEEK